MSSIKIIKFLLVVSVVELIECQNIFSGLEQGGRRRQAPLGACDRIASQGVLNCMENFLPTSVISRFTSGGGRGSSGDICCNYSKYKACINGLNDGLRIAMQRERCSKTLSSRLIKSYSENTVGLPLKSLCDSSGSTSKCPKSKKRGSKRSSKRVPEQPLDSNPVSGILNSGRDALGGGGLGGGLLGGGDSPLNPVRDVFSRGTDTLREGTQTFLKRGQDLFGGLTGGLTGGRDLSRSSSEGSSSFLKPAEDIFGGITGGKRGGLFSGESSGEGRGDKGGANPLTGLIDQGRVGLTQSAETLMKAGQGIFGSLTGGGLLGGVGGIPGGLNGDVLTGGLSRSFTGKSKSDGQSPLKPVEDIFGGLTRGLGGGL